MDNFNYLEYVGGGFVFLSLMKAIDKPINEIVEKDLMVIDDTVQEEYDTSFDSYINNYDNFYDYKCDEDFLDDEDDDDHPEQVTLQIRVAIVKSFNSDSSRHPP